MTSSAITLPSPGTQTGKTFDGWYNGSTRVGGTGDSYTPTANVTLQAHWSVAQYTVTFKNGNTTLTTNTVSHGGTITTTTYNLSGKVFCGWYNDSNLTSAFSNSTAITADKTLWGYFVDPLRFTTSPVASATITYSQNMGAILFDAVKSESAYKVLWDFGDGFTSDLKSVYHSYAEPGTYSVKLSVYNYNDEVDVKEYKVTVTDSGFSESPSDDSLKYAVYGILIAVAATFVIARPF